MLRLRQSSPATAGPETIAAISAGMGGCGGFGAEGECVAHAAPRLDRLGRPEPLAPNGGAAYGTPLKLCTPPEKLPRSRPWPVSTMVSVETVVGVISVPVILHLPRTLATARPYLARAESIVERSRSSSVSARRPGRT